MANENSAYDLVTSIKCITIYENSLRQLQPPNRQGYMKSYSYS